MDKTYLCRFFAFCCVYSVRILGQEPVSILDFRYPETQAMDWKGNLTGKFLGLNTNYNYVSNTFYEQTRNVKSRSLGISSSFLFFHSKENHDHTVSAFASFFYHYSDETRKFIDEISITERTGIDDEKKGSARIHWDYAHYLQDEGLHFLGRYTLRYEGRYEKEILWSERIRKFFQFENRVAGGMGYGRMRDGTFVARALRILERLREDGVINREVTKEQVLEIVERLAHSREYTTNFERYEKHLIQDIVSALVEAGIVESGALTSYSIFRILEGYRESIEPRFFGWRVFYTFGSSHTQRLDSYQEGSSISRNFLKDSYYIHSVGGRFGHSLSHLTHVNVDIVAEFPARNPDTHFSISAHSSITYEYTEKVDITASYNFLREIWTDSYYWSGVTGYTRNLIQSILANFRFFIEDQVYFTVSVDYSWQRSHSYPGTRGTSHRFFKANQFSFSFGLSYNII